ncbi:MAG TPA: tetratricopeptide repeat protein [Blastocatellia bacterium]|nr:tetratricopeptide repeat protein [Blastocatellia bacterium]
MAIVLLLFVVACGRSVDDSLQRARDAWDSEDFETAAKEYEHYLESNPAGETSRAARYQLANIYYLNLHRYEQARLHYREFLNQDPAHPDAPAARERLAEVLGEMGRSYEAIAEYEALNPRDFTEGRRIRLKVADLYFDQKNYSQALTEYAKVIEGVAYDELSERAYLREASIYHLARGQYKQALPVYQQLASQSLDPKVRLRATYGIADCYAALYQWDDAMKTLRGIQEPSEQAYITRRVGEFEKQKREAAQAQSGIRRPE